MKIMVTKTYNLISQKLKWDKVKTFAYQEEKFCILNEPQMTSFLDKVHLFGYMA